MKHTIIILLCFLCGHAYTLQAEDANAQQYQDSILKVAQAMPSTPDKLEYLRDIVYRHQYEGTLRHAGFNNQGICDEVVYAKVRSAALDEEPG